MEEAVQGIVDRVIESMHDNLGEHFVTHDMARTAMYSKFHFSRVFQRAAGVSPGRLLALIRLQEAKRLLTCTSLSVTAISHQVGYSSVGTFGSRFRSEVGMTPATYRQMRQLSSQLPAEWRHPNARLATMGGEVRVPAGSAPGLIFIGLFPERIPQGAPIRCSVLQRPGPYTLTQVPPGTWYLVAHSVSLLAGALTPGRESMLGEGPFRADDVLNAGSRGPITVRSGVSVGQLDVHLHSITALDLPVLALLDVRAVAMAAEAVS